MTEHAVYNVLLVGWMALTAIIFPFLFWVSAPYGRHTRKGWGPMIPDRLGWVAMEAPAVLVFAACFVLGWKQSTVTAWVFLAMWEAHYIHRAFIYPFTLRGKGKQMPLVIAGSAFTFNTVNAYLNGRYLFTFSRAYPLEWLWSARFVAGAILFVTGYIVNRQADRTLRNLRRPGESGYRIPYGGLYRWVSSPNYLGEITEWIGWAVATWSWAGLAFALWSFANLAPRAWFHHRWYREHFADYPPQRKALVPGLW